MNDLGPTSLETGSWQAAQDFLKAATRSPDQPAITAEGQSLSYGALLARVTQLAAALAADERAADAPVTAIYLSRGIDTYAAVLAALLRGHAYVPLNPKFPPERNRYILDRSGATALFHAPEDAVAVQQILAADSGELSPAQPRCLAMGALPPAPATLPARLHNNPYAYIRFTSGSTGRPKGVALRHSNLGAYLDAVFQLTDYSPADRLSQTFDLTFDLSVHDMFVCWRAGAHLVVPTAQDLEAPGDYVLREQITCWFSVPSLAQKMRQQGALQPGALSSLRLSLFCGEALPVELAQAWSRATTNRVENWYGPTEATISCTRFVLPADPAQIRGRNGLVPIGTALPGMTARVLKEDGSAAAPGESGELLMCGPQVADGYLQDAEKTAAAFVIPTGQQAIHYRTGDRVHVQPDGSLEFIERMDNQIKIRGYRVELGEIEAVLRATAPGCEAVVVPLPLKSPSPTALVGVIEGYDGPGREVRKAMADKLPDYMSPARVLVMKHFPKNASGKVDRGAIGQRVVKRLEKMNAAAQPKGRMKRYDRLIQFAQEVNPALSRAEIEKAENLMDAGLDSMGFVDFTIKLEKQFGLELTQDSAAELSRMSLWQMVVFIRKSLEARNESRFQPPTGNKIDSAALKQHLHYRAMRALDALDKFPAYAAEPGTPPLVPFIGSSGFMRAICPATLQTAAQARGQQIRAANLGMAMLSAKGIAELCEYIRDTLQAQQRRLPLAVLEMEIMQLSIMPPAGDIEILADYKAGVFENIPRKHYDADTIWDTATGGAIARSTAPRPGRHATQANWERKRNQEIRDAFVGKIRMDAKTVQTWLRGLKALQEISEETVAVIHPIQCPNLTALRAAHAPNHFLNVVEQTRAETNVRVILDTEFSMQDGDFKNISHMNDYQGRQNFSAQLARLLFC
jgi:amino acid adenylation domain-containing protein